MTNKLTLIKRSNPVCPQCDNMQKALDEEGISYDVIDIAVNPEAVEKYDIMSVPVILIGEDGSNQIKLNGVQPVGLIQTFLED